MRDMKGPGPPHTSTNPEDSARATAARYRYQYAAKVLCTANLPGTSQSTPSVLPGVYQTAINVHNPHEKAVTLRKKLAVAVPPGGQKPGPVSRFSKESLEPDQAISISCNEVARDFGITFVHGAEGFLVIESTDRLDVVAVYTAGKRGGEVESIAVEQIIGHEIR
jgi:hypothetical protein